MKVTNDPQISPLRTPAPSPTPARKETQTATAPRSTGDMASFLGISSEELTAGVREGLGKLITEVERLRHELTVREKRIAYLEQLADEDPLTPLLNRRAFVRELSRMMAFSQRYGTPSSVLYFDVDNMKAVNDTHGHSAGDAALTHVANILVDNVRGSDIVGRLGGDEFGVVLANADQAVAREKGTSLIRLISETPFAFGERELSISATFGAYAFDANSEPNEILSAADRAMYEAKKTGVNAASGDDIGEKLVL